MIVPSVISGVVASELVSSESKTPTNLNASARPKDICSSVGLVPNASVAPVATFNCLHNCVVLTFDERISRVNENLMSMTSEIEDYVVDTIMGRQTDE